MGVGDCIGRKMTPTDSREVFTINVGSNMSLDSRRADIESQSPLTKSPSSSSCTKKSFWTGIIQFGGLILIVMAVYGLFESKLIPSHKAGFFCNDPALSFPYTGDTVSDKFLIGTMFAVPFVVVLVTEFLTQEFSIKLSIMETARIYKCYFYGVILNFIVMETMKIITGNPRPTFFALCEPDTAKTCNGTEFVANFKCTSTQYSEYMQKDSYKSFPSGHTWLSVYAGLFVAWYLQRRAWSTKMFLLVPLLQVTCILYAATSSLTRITDHRHHWWDVLVGLVLGVCSVLYLTIVLLENLPTRSKNKGSSSTFVYDNTEVADETRVTY